LSSSRTPDGSLARQLNCRLGVACALLASYVLFGNGQSATKVATLMTARGVTCVEERGTFDSTVKSEPVHKRYVVRYPKSKDQWNRKLVVGAHGGSGGVERHADGTPIGTAENALDDLIGAHAVENGFAYTSMDRDGISGTRDGQALTYGFTRFARERLAAAGVPTPSKTYLVGLSMGGGIARYASEDSAKVYDAILIVAGANGDVPTRLDRQAELARLWPQVDPDRNPGLREPSDAVRQYAEADGTPTAARVYWPFIGRTSTLDSLRGSLEQFGLIGLSNDELAAFRYEKYRQRAPFADNVARDNTTGKVLVPTLEVVGTYDDIVFKEISAYDRKVSVAEGSPKPSMLHRLYQVEGVWHISGDDDAAESFQYAMKQMGIGEATQRALREGSSYLATVREAFDLLDQWIETGAAPPASQTVKPGEALAR
jgi:pimeloyl-ACP methyl ester carboxylesterase